MEAHTGKIKVWTCDNVAGMILEGKDGWEQDGGRERLTEKASHGCMGCDMSFRGIALGQRVKQGKRATQSRNEAAPTCRAVPQLRLRAWLDH